MKRAEIEHLLPAVFRRAVPQAPGLLRGLLDAMETLHAHPDSVLGSLETFFDPRRAPDAFVPFLASWVDLDRFFDRSFGLHPQDEGLEPFSAGLGHLRELTGRAAYLSRWRGTRRGLVAFLETATGITGFEVVEAPVEKAFHVQVRVPEAARPHDALIQRIIQSEKPAYVTYDTEYFSA